MTIDLNVMFVVVSVRVIVSVLVLRKKGLNYVLAVRAECGNPIDRERHNCLLHTTYITPEFLLP